MERAGHLELRVVAAFGLTGCGVERIGEPGDGACIPAAVQAIFDARCNLGASCHSAGSKNVSLAAGDSASIIGGSSVQSGLPLVELGSIEGSYLAHKIMAMPPVPIASGTRMPQNANFDDPALAEDMAVLLGWIGGATLVGCVGGGSSSGGNEVLACGIADLDPSGTSTLVAGDAAMQIPTEIGDIFSANCGCHLTTATMLERNATPYPASLPFKMSTWADWQADYAPGVPMLQQARGRLDPSALSIMPQAVTCNIGDGETMPPEQRTRLLEWIDAGGPDGASWP